MNAAAVRVSLAERDVVVRAVDAPGRGAVRLEDGQLTVHTGADAPRLAVVVRCTNRGMCVRPSAALLPAGAQTLSVAVRPTPALLADMLQRGSEANVPWVRLMVQWFEVDDALDARLAAMAPEERLNELRALPCAEPVASEVLRHSVEGRVVVARERAPPPPPGRVLSVQSHTVSGYVGNKSAVFPMQLLGLDVDPINSVQFSNHTGYPRFTGEVLNGEQLLALADGLAGNGLLEYTHLLTGYIGSVSFLESVRELLRRARAQNPALTYVCDPVMGDDGRLYVPAELVPVFRDQLVPEATVLTPNQFEAELLTGLSIRTEADARRACAALHALGPRVVVLTSARFGGSPERLVVLASVRDGGGLFRLATPLLEGSYTGTGDLFAALLLAWMHRVSDDVGACVELVHATLQAVLANTPPGGELRLIQSKADIEEPEVAQPVERVAAGVGAVVLGPCGFSLSFSDVQVVDSLEAVPEGVHISNVVIVGDAEFLRPHANSGATLCCTSSSSAAACAYDVVVAGAEEVEKVVFG